MYVYNNNNKTKKKEERDKRYFLRVQCQTTITWKRDNSFQNSDLWVSTFFFFFFFILYSSLFFQFYFINVALFFRAWIIYHEYWNVYTEYNSLFFFFSLFILSFFFLSQTRLLSFICFKFNKHSQYYFKCLMKNSFWIQTTTHAN